MAMVSSTTPRLEARWPPVRLIFSIKKLRISSANVPISSGDNSFRSSGPLIRSNIMVPFPKPCTGPPSPAVPIFCG